MNKILVFMLKIDGNYTNQGYCFELNENQPYIIQKNENTFHFNDISLFHCRLILKDENVYISDMGSEYGTYLNGMLIGIRPNGLSDNDVFANLNEYISMPLKIKIGDIIQLGDHVELYLKTIINEEIKDKKDIIPGYHYLGTIHSDERCQICLVENKETKRNYALKIWNKGIINKYIYPAFEKEMKTSQNFNHPHFIKEYELKWDDNQNVPYLLMDYYKYNIRDIFNDTKNLQETIIEVLIQLLEGLDYLYQKGLAHHRLKPQNIFVEKKENSFCLKIADSCLKKAYHHVDFDLIPESDLSLENYCFNPRQQFLMPEHNDISIDIYAVVAIVYYLASGKTVKPFVDEDPCMTVLKRQPLPVEFFLYDLDKELIEIINRALNDQNENLYYQKPQDLINELKQIKNK